MSKKRFNDRNMAPKEHLINRVLGLHENHFYKLKESNEIHYFNRLSELSKIEIKDSNTDNFQSIDICPIIKLFPPETTDVGKNESWRFAYRDRFNEVNNIYRIRFDLDDEILTCTLNIRTEIHAVRIFMIPALLGSIFGPLGEYFDFSLFQYILWPSLIYYSWIYGQLMRSRFYAVRWFDIVLSD